MSKDNFLNPVEIWNLAPGDIIMANGSLARVYSCSLDGTLSVQLIKPDDAETFEIPYDSRILSGDDIYTIGVVRLEKAMLLCNGFTENDIVDDDTDEVTYNLIDDANNGLFQLEGRKGSESLYFAVWGGVDLYFEIAHIHEFQHLLRSCGQVRLANNFKV